MSKLRPNDIWQLPHTDVEDTAIRALKAELEFLAYVIRECPRLQSRITQNCRRLEDEFEKVAAHGRGCPCNACMRRREQANTERDRKGNK